jgi:hypothetical protein
MLALPSAKRSGSRPWQNVRDSNPRYDPQAPKSRPPDRWNARMTRQVYTNETHPTPPAVAEVLDAGVPKTHITIQNADKPSVSSVFCTPASLRGGSDCAQRRCVTWGSVKAMRRGV